MRTDTINMPDSVEYPDNLPSAYTRFPSPPTDSTTLNSQNTGYLKGKNPQSMSQKQKMLDPESLIVSPLVPGKKISVIFFLGYDTARAIIYFIIQTGRLSRVAEVLKIIKVTSLLK